MSLQGPLCSLGQHKQFRWLELRLEQAPGSETLGSLREKGQSEQRKWLCDREALLSGNP